MMDGSLYANTYTHVTHDPSKLVDDGVPWHTSVPKDCLEAVGPSSAEFPLKHHNHFLNQLLKPTSSSELCKLHTLPLTPAPLEALQRLWLCLYAALEYLQCSVPSSGLLLRAGGCCTSASMNTSAFWPGKRCHTKPGISGI